jgi:hypothetical protein
MPSCHRAIVPSFRSDKYPSPIQRRPESQPQLIRNKMADKMGRPTKRSGYMYRHATLRLAVAELEREGFKRSRNDEAEHRKSACDIVAEAMVALGC